MAMAGRSTKSPRSVQEYECESKSNAVAGKLPQSKSSCSRAIPTSRDSVWRFPIGLRS
jgi:hypothetical protein